MASKEAKLYPEGLVESQKRQPQALCTSKSKLPENEKLYISSLAVFEQLIGFRDVVINFTDSWRELQARNLHR